MQNAKATPAVSITQAHGHHAHSNIPSFCVSRALVVFVLLLFCVLLCYYNKAARLYTAGLKAALWMLLYCMFFMMLALLLMLMLLLWAPRVGMSIANGVLMAIAPSCGGGCSVSRLCTLHVVAGHSRELKALKRPKHPHTRRGRGLLLMP